MSAGQPTIYSPEKLEKSEYYLTNFRSVGDQIPSNAGLADFLEVAKRTIYGWRDKHPEFLHILQRIQGKQEKILLNSGLDSTFNSNICKLVLGKHGYHDKQDVQGQVEVTKIERVIKNDNTTD